MVSRTVRTHPRIALLAVITIVIFVAASAYAISLLNAAGELPWQEDPTRISEGIAPFSGIFDTATATAVATVVGTETP